MGRQGAQAGFILKILRPPGRFTHDLFSRAAPASARKSLIFLDPPSAAWPAVSDNARSVNFAKREGGAVLSRLERRAVPRRKEREHC